MTERSPQLFRRDKGDEHKWARCKPSTGHRQISITADDYAHIALEARREALKEMNTLLAACE